MKDSRKRVVNSCRMYFYTLLNFFSAVKNPENTKTSSIAYRKDKELLQKLR